MAKKLAGTMSKKWTALPKRKADDISTFCVWRCIKVDAACTVCKLHSVQVAQCAACTVCRLHTPRELMQMQICSGNYCNDRCTRYCCCFFVVAVKYTEEREGRRAGCLSICSEAFWKLPKNNKLLSVLEVVKLGKSYNWLVQKIFAICVTYKIIDMYNVTHISYRCMWYTCVQHVEHT